jgi:hypothetical protein
MVVPSNDSKLTITELHWIGQNIFLALWSKSIENWGQFITGNFDGMGTL